MLPGKGMCLKQEDQLRGTRKLRRAAEPAMAAVERLQEGGDAVLDRLGAGHRGSIRRGLVRTGHLAEPVENPVRRVQHFLALLAPRARKLLQHVHESRSAPPRFGWKVRAAEKWLQVGREPHAHRPAARARRRLHERHVDAIDVRPLFPIDLDRHEVAIERARDRRVLERLVLHDVAPVTRRISDRQKNWLVLARRPCERFLGPRKPVDRVVGVLEKVGTALSRKAVGHLRSIIRCGGQERSLRGLSVRRVRRVRGTT